MNSQVVLEYQWQYLLSFLPSEDDLERTAKAHGALLRKRGIGSASALLRLGFAYGFCGMSLREAAAWAKVTGVADISDVALMKRLRNASDWFGKLLAHKLAEYAPPPAVSKKGVRIRLVDATSISRPGSEGTDWRLHMGLSLSDLTIDHIELTDNSGGESLNRFVVGPGEVIIGDHGYANRRGIMSIHDTGGDFIVRLNWQTVPLQDRQGKRLDILNFLRGIPEAKAGDLEVRVAPFPKQGIPSMPARFVAVRKSEAAAEIARKKVLSERSRKGRSVDPRTLESAGYVFVLTSLPQEDFSPEEVLELYRFRWQIELAFKRLKSLLHLDNLPARDPPLARSILSMKLLAALLLEDFTERFLSFSPWGFRLAHPAPVIVADSEGPS